MFDTPIVFIIFNRENTAFKVFEKIRKIKPSKLFIVADGPRTLDERTLTDKTRALTENIDWKCEVYRDYSEKNLGCKERVASGINWAFEKVDRAIILEDDCVPNQSFFQFCEELLEKYKNEDRVMHICGTNFHQKNPSFDIKESYYFSKISQNWGWATWKRSWMKYYKPHMEGWPEFRKSSSFKNWISNQLFRDYWTYVFDRRARKEIDDWDIAWTYSCMTRNGLCIVPTKNLVTNIGSEPGGTHTFKPNLNTHTPIDSMDFPLIHPKIEVDEEADDYTHRTIYGVNTNFERKILSFFKNNFPILYKNVKLLMK